MKALNYDNIRSECKGWRYLDPHRWDKPTPKHRRCKKCGLTMRTANLNFPEWRYMEYEGWLRSVDSEKQSTSRKERDTAAREARRMKSRARSVNETPNQPAKPRDDLLWDGWVGAPVKAPVIVDKDDHDEIQDL